MDKQEVALSEITNQLKKIIKNTDSILMVRMNFWTMYMVFAGTFDSFFDAPERGTQEWPLGAFGKLSRHYGGDGYFVIDNTIGDGQILVDTEKKG